VAISAVSIALERATDQNPNSKNIDPQFQLRAAARAAKARAARRRKARPSQPFYERKSSSASGSTHKEEANAEGAMDEGTFASDSETEEVTETEAEPSSGLQPMYVFILC
jgi:hypothetical protein